MVDVAFKAESTRPSGSRWTKLLISLQRRSCVVLWLSRFFQLSMMLPSCLRQRLTPNRSQVLPMPVTRLPWRERVVPLARKRIVQWTTRNSTRKRRHPETDVGDSEEDIGYREDVSGQEESVNCTIILRAVPVVVLESCKRCFDSVCVDMCGLAQRVHIPSLRTVQHAALAHLAATAPSKLDSRKRMSALVACVA